MGEMAPPEVEAAANPEAEEQPILSLDILSTVKKCQLQNGVRHDDYQRYRQYCTRRLKRIRTNEAVKFSHRAPKGPRGKYEKKDVTADLCKNSLFLLIPLMNAERAWSYAMQLKQDNEVEGEDLRRTAHMIRRLSKAAKWASKLKDLCSNLGDDRTALQAEAYAAWMNGNFFLEKDMLKEALPLFSQKEMMQEKLDNLELVIMYCTRYLSQEGADSQELVDMMSKGKHSSSQIQSKINKVISESMKIQAHEGFQVNLLGKSIPVRNEKCALLLLAAQGNQKTLDGLTVNVETVDEGEWEKIDTLFVDTFSKYDDAARQVRNDLSTNSNSGSANAPAVEIPQEHLMEELSLLRFYIKITKLDKVIRRNILLGIRLENKFEQEKKDGVESSKTKGQKKQVKGRMRPQDLQRMFEKIAQNISNQLDIINEAKKETSGGEEEIRKLTLQQDTYEARKHYYEAVAHSNSGKWQEALQAYEQSVDMLQDALTEEGKKLLNEVDIEDLHKFQKKATVGKRLSEARAFLAKAGSGNDDTTNEPVDGGRPLCERLEENEVGDIVEFPPGLTSVSARPIMFDLAFNRMEAPDFSDRTKAGTKSPSQQSTGWLSNARGWFGSGRS